MADSSYAMDSDTYSSEDSDASNCKGKYRESNVKSVFKTNRKEKCTTRNAILARQNRFRKKMYIQNLESEITKLKNIKEKLNSIVDNQSLIISDLRKEVKYIRSILTNSSDLSNLIKNISTSTGMSVTTSLDKSLTVKNNCVSKPDNVTHPWKENFNSPDSLDFADLNLPHLPFPEVCIDNLTDVCFDNDSISIPTWQEHNYTKSEFDDPGVCLHVSKHKVSLEFCASCSNNAEETWKELE